ncbi:hypothetical protein D3C78_1937200 [compost metagenome]
MNQLGNLMSVIIASQVQFITCFEDETVHVTAMQSFRFFSPDAECTTQRAGKSAKMTQVGLIHDA